MAIIIQEKEKGVNWFAILVVLFILLVIGLSVYFLFLTPAPYIEQIAPVEGPLIDQIPQDYGAGLSIPPFSDFHRFPAPDPGTLGRDNPFAGL